MHKKNALLPDHHVILVDDATQGTVLDGISVSYYHAGSALKTEDIEQKKLR